MKHSTENPLCWDIDQSWTSFLKPNPGLRLNTLDFSDLWDEEDLGLESTDEDGQTSASEASEVPQRPPAPPPLPPVAPPLPLPSPHDKAPACRTLRLHWRELQHLPPLPRVTRFGTQTIWAGLEPVRLDTNRLGFLFETKGSGALCGTLGAQRWQTCVSVLSIKRSNIVTIALSSLPPPHLLPPAIYSMDDSVLDRDHVQRLQALVPSEEELSLIREAQVQSPSSPLASAENCLLTLGEIPHLSIRLQLWAFALDYDSLEREIAEPLFHLKIAMEQLAANQTFRCILATVLAIGNFLNGVKARGFELSYLGKLSQVRDTHSRQPLLQHVCVLLLQLYPHSSDLYSDITAVTRASKCDYSLVQLNLTHLEGLCEASWEQLRLLDRADERGRVEKDGKKRWGLKGPVAPEITLRRKLPRFLKDCEERLKVLRAVHRRVINRFHSFLLFLGYSRSMVRETKAEDFCKTVSDFSLEYRATRLTLLQQGEREKGRERDKEKERGVETPGLKRRHGQAGQTRAQENLQQCTLEEVLSTPESLFRADLTLSRHRKTNNNFTGPFYQKMKW